jgi:hypothetical protein
MSAVPADQAPTNVEFQWLAALVRAEHARQEYAQYLRAADTDETVERRLWLQLWHAERRREELFRMLS